MVLNKDGEKTGMFRWAYKIGIAAFLVIALAGAAGGVFLTRNALEHIKEEGRAAASVEADHMISVFEKITSGVRVISGSPWISPALESGKPEDIERANSVLDRYNEGLGSSVSYLLNKEGLVMASSNRGAADSFVGEFYEFRPYFKEAMAGKPFRYLAVGVTAGIKNFYASHPVAGPEGTPIGVVAIKKDLDNIEKTLSRNRYCFLVSPEGIVFLSSDPRLNLKSLGNIGYEEQNRLLSSEQFGDKPFEIIMAERPVDGGLVIFRGELLVSTKSQINEEGWSVVVFERLSGVFAMAAFGLAGTLFILGLAAAYRGYLRRSYRGMAVLKESEDKFKCLSDAMFEGVVIHRDGRIVEFNRRFADMLGYEPGEIEGTNIFDHIAYEDKGEVMVKAAKGYAEPYEARVVKKNGASFSAEICGKPFIYRGANARMVSIHDITMQKNSRSILERAAQQWETTFNSIPDPVSIHDKQFRIVKANKAFENYFGLKPGEAIGRKCHELVHGTERPIDQCILQKVVMAKAKNTCLLHDPQKGSYLDVTAAPIFSEAGEVDGVVHLIRDISQSKKLEESIKESEEKFRLLYESSQDAIMTLRPPDWKFTAGNPATVKLFGVEDEKEFVSREPWQLSPAHQPDGESSSSKAKRMIGTAMEQGSHFFEWTHRKANGEDFPATVLLTRVEVSGGAFLQATVRDISEDKKAKEKLARLNQQNELILSSVAEGILGVDLQGNHTFVNPVAARMLGYEIEELLGRSSHSAWHHSRPDGSPYPKEESGIYSVYREGTVHRSSTEVFWRKDGTSFPVEYASTPIYEQGRLIGAVVTFSDITERKKAELAIKKAYSQITQIFQGVGDGVCVIDAGGAVIQMNRMFSNMLGVGEADSVGKKHTQVLPPAISLIYHDAIKRLEGKETRIERDFTLDRQDGAGIPCIMTVTPFFDVNDKMTGIILSLKDITERKSAEKALLENVKLKNNFIAMVSHELRTPLTAIKEGIGIVMDGSAGKVNDEQKDFLDTAHRNVVRLSRLINDVLDFSKLRAGKMVMKMEEGDLRLVAQEVVKANGSLASAKGIFIRTETSWDVPMVKFDKDKINQVVSNLVNNAIKFTDTGGITVSFSEKDKEVIVSVCDTGRGIKEEDIPKLFSEFGQVDDPKNRKAGGTGLGLAISKQIVELHGGNMWVRSERDKGSVFSFSLPLERKYKILVVDDDVHLQEFTGKILHAKGYVVLRAVTGLEAVEIAKTRKPDLIVLDMRLPDMNGYEVIGRLRSDEELAGIPLLVISGYEEEFHRLDKMKGGVLPRMTKPFSNEDFSEMIKTILNL